MLANGLKPIGPYPGAAKEWLCECVQCGARFTSRLMYMSRAGGRCLLCYRRRRAEELRMPEHVAVDLMRAAGLEPLEPYREADANWRCRCLGCGAEVFPRYYQVKAGAGGCRACGGKKISAKRRGDAEEAAQILRNSGLEPLETYPGDKRLWSCICLKCGYVFNTRRMIVKSGSGCPVCAKFGFDPAAPAVVYVLFHEELEAVKIGITGTGTKRIKLFVGQGWSCFKVMNFTEGASARAVEQAVLRHVQDELGIKDHLPPEETRRTSGWSETFPLTRLAPADLWRLVLRFSETEAVGSPSGDSLAA